MQNIIPPTMCLHLWMLIQAYKSWVKLNNLRGHDKGQQLWDDDSLPTTLVNGSKLSWTNIWTEICNKLHGRCEKFNREGFFWKSTRWTTGFALKIELLSAEDLL